MIWLMLVRYGLERAYILQDLIAWRPSIWDRYTLSTEEETFVKVCFVEPHLRHMMMTG